MSSSDEEVKGREETTRIWTAENARENALMRAAVTRFSYRIFNIAHGLRARRVARASDRGWFIFRRARETIKTHTSGLKIEKKTPSDITGKKSQYREKPSRAPRM